MKTTINFLETIIDLYKVLELDKNTATNDQIDKKYHSIKNSIYTGKKNGEVDFSDDQKEKLEHIELAHKVLIDRNKRNNYDLALKTAKENENLLSKKETIVGENQNTISNEKIDWKDNPKTKFSTGEYIVFILIIMLFIGILGVSLDKINKSQNQPQVPREIRAAIPTKEITMTPTIFVNEEKKQALVVAEKFSNFLQEGNENAKKLLDPDSRSYKDNIESIDEIVYAKNKYGDYVRIYDLSVSNYDNGKITITGYLEDRSRMGWNKYFLDIFLIKVEDNWLISDWELLKT